MSTRVPYQYVALRCVPRPEREEFVNVGVLLHCHDADLLALAHHLDVARLTALDPRLDVDQVRASLRFVESVCAGDERTGAAGAASLGQRFGFLRAPRSTVLQPGPVHGGTTLDPVTELDRLLECLVR